jgi:hypothetical protein
MNKIFLKSTLFLLATVLIGFCYHNNKITNPCNQLNLLQNNKVRSIKLKDELLNYLKLNQTRSDLANKTGGVFELYEFSTPIEKYISDKELKEKIRYILVKNNRPVYDFKEPYEILAVGIGYGRTYITFENNEQADSRVYCNHELSQEATFFENFISKNKLQEK